MNQPTQKSIELVRIQSKHKNIYRKQARKKERTKRRSSTKSYLLFQWIFIYYILRVGFALLCKVKAGIEWAERGLSHEYR